MVCKCFKNLKMQVQILTLILLVLYVNGSKILFVAITPTRSHQKPFQIIWKGLVERGHEVHVLTPNPIKNSNLSNLHQYDLSDFYALKADPSTKDEMKYRFHKATFLSAFSKDIIVTKWLSKLYKYTINHKETRRLIDENETFDAVIVEWLFPTFASFGPYFQAPLIGVTSLGAPLVALDTLGNPSHPITAPEMNLPLPHHNLSFKERVFSVLYSIYVRIYYHLVVLPREDATVKKYLSSELPYLGDIERNVSILLMNRNPILHRIMPLFPNVIELGSVNSNKSSPVPLDAAVKKFLDESQEDVIFFSFGTSMNSTLLEDSILEKFKNTFKSIPYKVVWKWDVNLMPNKPANVFISSWVSQVALLEHPKVKLFITQGGLQSIEETIAAHKPIIGIPFHSDQTTNIDSCEKLGLGKMLDMNDLTEETLRSYILEIIINNAKYVENIKKIDKLLQDQPQDGLEKAIWWIEYVIRHKGAKHLRNMAVDMPWWQYLMIDILSFILGILLSLSFVCYYMFKIIVYAIFKFKHFYNAIINKEKKKQ